LIQKQLENNHPKDREDGRITLLNVREMGFKDKRWLSLVISDSATRDLIR
jgi:hypothetical protein